MATPAPFFAAFADYVHQQRDAISRQWMPLVRHSPDVPGAEHISPEALQDHVPALMDDLVERLRLDLGRGSQAGKQPPATPAATGASSGRRATTSRS